MKHHRCDVNINRGQMLPDNTEDNAMDDKEMTEVTVEEALQMEIIVNQALTDILIEKGIITEEELLEKIEALKEQLQ